MTLLGRLFQLFSPGDPRAFGQRRHPRWAAARSAHLESQPACAACGASADPEVHHVLPFHLYPERELDPRNLLTLCGPGGRNCHLLVGHCLNWSWYNKNARRDAAFLAGMLRGAVKERADGDLP